MTSLNSEKIFAPHEPAYFSNIRFLTTLLYIREVAALTDNWYRLIMVNKIFVFCLFPMTILISFDNLVAVVLDLDQRVPCCMFQRPESTQ